MRRRAFVAGVLLGGLLALAALSFLGCASTSSSTSIRVEGLGNVRLRLEAPDEVVLIPWSITPGIRGPHLWVAIRCHCGAVHVGVLLPEEGGAEVRLWTINNTPPYGGTTEGGLQ